jgi:CPA1 family monovalent cation:H+ antiporter
VAVDPISIVTLIAVVLLVGIIVSWFAGKVKLPDVLFLLLAGMALGLPTIAGKRLIGFSDPFVASISVIALALIIFGSTAKIKLKEVDSWSLRALKLTFTFTFLHLIIFSTAVHFFVGFPWGISILIASILAGTSPDIILQLLADCKHKIVELLKLESIFNTPLTVIIPFIVLDLMSGTVSAGVTEEFLARLAPFLTTIVAGIGAGVVVALILMKIMQRATNTSYGYLAVLVSVLLTYVLAEGLKGNGVLAVTTLGLFFGNSTIKDKAQLLTFENLLAKVLYIFVFMLLGSLIVELPLTATFFYQSFSLFLIYLIVRFIAVWLSVHKDTPMKEIVYATLNAAKGIATATVIFTFVVLTKIRPDYAVLIPFIDSIRDISLAIILYSIVLAAITELFSKYFIGMKINTKAKKVNARANLKA